MRGVSALALLLLLLLLPSSASWWWRNSEPADSTSAVGGLLFEYIVSGPIPSQPLALPAEDDVQSSVLESAPSAHSRESSENIPLGPQNVKQFSGGGVGDESVDAGADAGVGFWSDGKALLTPRCPPAPPPLHPCGKRCSKMHVHFAIE